MCAVWSKYRSPGLSKVPEKDTKSRAVIEKMREEEIEHANKALDLGGVELPAPIKMAMRSTAKIMTGTARII
jgi:ubiquinone biosynthesis monooxygenase Coq7